MAKISPAQLKSALMPLQEWLLDTGKTSNISPSQQPDSAVIAHATRMSVEYFAQIAPGGAIELRIPPWIAVQIIAGGNHTRGVPPNVIEMDAHTWLQLFIGLIDYPTAINQGLVEASGIKCAEIAVFLPVLSTKVL